VAALSEADAEALQRAMAARVSCVDRLAGAPRTVAGVDVIYDDAAGRARAGVVLLSFPELALLEETSAEEPVAAAYVPGLFSLREAPAALAALRRLSRLPEAVVCDGHGRAHPRRCGLACHVGIELDVPTVGVAKSVLVGSHGPLAAERGATAEIVDGGEVVGAALRTQTGVRPVYVSVGHAISLPSALRLVLACAPRYRLPETTRGADRVSRDHPRPRSTLHPPRPSTPTRT
jgi:deoxyribonuclease V